MSTKTKEEYLLDLSSYFISMCSEFAGIIVKIPKVYINNEEECKTDGRVVKVGNPFFTLDIYKQLYVLLKVSMAVALRHHVRANEIYHHDTALKVWNVSSELVINYSIEDYIDKKLENVDKYSSQSFTLEILNKINNNEIDIDFDLSNAEQVFSILLNHINNDSSNNLSAKLNSVTNIFSPPFEDTNQILSESGLESEINSEVQDLIWSKRLDEAINQIAGNDPSNKLLRLKKELPKVKVHWDTILRQFLTSRLLNEKESNWKRFSRKNMAGITEIFEPFRDRKKGIKKLALCWDVSGSCFSSTIISKFVANIEVVHKLTGCELVLIPFDDDVNEAEVSILKPAESLKNLIDNNKIMFLGGGGTSFAPPLRYADKVKADVIVVLTDGYGVFPEPNKTPTIWATTGDHSPWGKNITIKD
jgi:predicted metal-dependent peptidase